MRPAAPSGAPPFCRVTVRAPGRRVDVALPVDVPLAELVPLVLELFAEPFPPSGRPEPWRFTGATGTPLPPGATLHELGVLAGETLRLGPAGPPPPAPVFDDPVDALAALAPGARPDRRRPAVAAVAVVTAAAALLATARTGGGPGSWVAAAVGGVGALLALARAARVARSGAVDGGSAAGPDVAAGEEGADRSAALVPAYCALPLAAAAGWAALPGPPGLAPLLLAAVACGIAAAFGQVGVRAPAPVLIATVVVAAATATAVVVGWWFGVAVPALSAVGAALALSAGPLVPRLVLRSAGLPRPVVPTDAGELTAADAGPDLLPPAELAERARSARAQLTGLTGGFAVLAAAAAPAAATAHPWAGPALATVAVAVLLLRARGLVDAAAVRVHLAAGIAAGVALVGLLAPAAGTVGRLGCAVALLGAAAAAVLALGPAAPGVAPTRAASPVARRALDITEGVLTALAVPLALAAAGVFAVVRAL